MRQTESASSVIDVVATAHGDLADAIEYARERIGRLGRLAQGPVTGARVRLSRHGDPAVERPVIAQANLIVDGRPIRAQVEGLTAREAVDRLEDRLRHRLEHTARHLEGGRGSASAADPREWRRGSEPTRRRRFFTRPVDERRVIRRKSFSVARCTVDEAVAEMNLLDYDFHLFTEKGTGVTGVLYRSPTGYRLALVAPDLADLLSPFESPVTLSEQPTPCLTLEAAIDRLGLLDLPFVFFIEAAEGRACVLYRRYDGHYGMITPAAS